jgi:hypothetical protein
MINFVTVIAFKTKYFIYNSLAGESAYRNDGTHSEISIAGGRLFVEAFVM